MTDAHPARWPALKPTLAHSLTHSWPFVDSITTRSFIPLHELRCLTQPSLIPTQDDPQIKATLSSCKYTALIRPLNASYPLAVLALLIHFLFPFPFVLRGQVSQSRPVIRYPCRGTDFSPLMTDFLFHSLCSCFILLNPTYVPQSWTITAMWSQSKHLP